MKFIKKINDKYWIIIILLTIFILTFVLNSLTPLVADDFYYSVFKGNRVTSLIDIFNSQVYQYFHWGGRIVAHTIAQIFLMMPKWIFNIFNTLMLIAEIYLIYKISQDGRKSKPILLIVIYFLLWFCLPVFGQTNIWLIGSCNYLWTTTIILLFIYSYMKDIDDTPKNIILICLLGIIAGWTNENTSFGCITVLCAFLVLKKLEKKKITKRNIFGLIGNILGFIIMIISPGNFIRNSRVIENHSFIFKISHRFMIYTENIATILLPLIIILTILISIYLYNKKKINRNIYPFIVGAVFSVYSMLLSPQFPERAWTGVIVFLIIPIISLLFDLEKISKLSHVVMIDIIIIASFSFAQGYFALVRDTYKLHNTWEYREKLIKDVKDKGNDKVEFLKYYPSEKRNPVYGIDDIQNDPNHWVNKSAKEYYSLEEIKTYG